MANSRWKSRSRDRFFSSWAPKSLWMVTTAMKLKDACFLEEKLWQQRQHIKKQRYHFDDKGVYNQDYGLSSNHVRMWEQDHKESRALKNQCFQTVVLEQTLKSPLDGKIKPVNLKGNQPWIFTGKPDAEAEAPVFWSFDANSLLIGKVPDARIDWRQKGKRVSEDEMAGWYHRCNEHELGQTPGSGEGQGGLVCCSPWGHKESDTTGQLNNNNEMMNV